MKLKTISKRIIVSSIICLGIFYRLSFADTLQSLKDKVKSCPPDLFYSLEELKELYFKDGKYVDFLKTLEEFPACAKNPYQNYYNALVKFNELKKLETEQNWQGYFDLKDSYEVEIANSLKEALEYFSKNPKDPAGLEAKYLNWFIEKEKTGIEKGAQLDALLNGLKNFSGNESGFNLLKDIAGRLQKEGLKQEAESIYAVYAEKIRSIEKDPFKLSVMADAAFVEGNFSLAVALYSAELKLISQSATKEEYNGILIRLINKFADNGWNAAKDPVYAEELFKLLEGNPEKIDADLMYLRAYNLERLKEFKSGLSAYQKLINYFPDDKRINEARFHAGIISLYILNNPDEALQYLLPLSLGKDSLSVSANYYLGLYYQWNKEIESAKKYYALAKSLLESESSINNDLLLRLLGERLVEVEENKVIEENLRLFLEATFSPQTVPNNLELNAVPAKNFVSQPQKLTASYFANSIGCFQPEIKFFWSGETGSNKINTDTQSFDASFAFSGSKVVFVTFQSAGSVSGKQLEIMDVYVKE